jgi:hypothetical protein
VLPRPRGATLDRKPYQGWFGILEQVIGPTGASYYSPGSGACHLDLFPWATTRKWGTLPPATRALLLRHVAQAIAAVIASAPLAMLVLNGSEVVRQFQVITGQQLDSHQTASWDLARNNGRPVAGVAYSGVITAIGSKPLGREIRVAGYNHNLQSSFGVSSAVRSSIGTWLATQYRSIATPDPAKTREAVTPGSDR